MTTDQRSFQRSLPFDDFAGDNPSSQGNESLIRPELVAWNELDLSDSATTVVSRLKGNGDDRKGMLLYERTEVDSILPTFPDVESIFLYDLHTKRTGIILVIHAAIQKVFCNEIRLSFQYMFDTHIPLVESGQMCQSVYQAPSNLYVVVPVDNRDDALRARNPVRQAIASINGIHTNNPRMGTLTWGEPFRFQYYKETATADLEMFGWCSRASIRSFSAFLVLDNSV